METRWMYHTSKTFRELRESSEGVCVIPMGCVEKHGLHMALGTDTMVAGKIAYLASQVECAAVFPDYIFGDVPERLNEHTDGTVTLPLETQLLMLEQLCDQIYLNGFRKILVYDAHGGNEWWLAAFIRNLDNKNKKYTVAKVFIKEQAPHRLAEYIEKNGKGSIPEFTSDDEELLLRLHRENMIVGHACFSEAAYMMGIAPETVHLDLLGEESGLPTGDSKPFTSAGIDLKSGGWHLEFPNAYCATDPYGVNERIGRAALRFESERLAKAIKVFKEDTSLLEAIDKP